MTTLSTQPTDRTDALNEMPCPPSPHETGTASGQTIRPGANDDGWIVPAPVKLSDGTTIRLYKDGEAWHAAFDAMRDAKMRICLEIYIFASDDTGRAVADFLCKKARDGLRVYVVYDSFGSLETDREMLRQMQRAGVNLQQFHPMLPWECRYSWRPVNRDHRKLIVIDNEVGGLGGINLATEYAGSSIIRALKPKAARMSRCELWRDNAISIRGPSVIHLMRSFARTWNYVLHGGRIRRAELIHNIHQGEFGLLASVPTLSSPLQPFLCNLLRSARTKILLTMAYFAPDEVLVNELCKAADRGVHVQLMLPGRGDVKLLVVAARSFYSRLMSHGVDIYERQNVVLHAKTLVIDGHISVVGSTNLDYRSIEYNCELSAIIRSEEFGQQMDDLFQHDIRFARQIFPEEWRTRPFCDRVGQWAVSRARYLL
ncbi:MAG TPA: phospholipase D-like domain-containing protein [Tepidisphaeraceae bacterium]|nr:phospholipase D-like domain-containing protein [Tepidisphaeraceae bacterium]